MKIKTKVRFHFLFLYVFRVSAIVIIEVVKQWDSIPGWRTIVLGIAFALKIKVKKIAITLTSTFESRTLYCSRACRIASVSERLHLNFKIFVVQSSIEILLERILWSSELIVEFWVWLLLSYRETRISVVVPMSFANLWRKILL